MQKWVSNYRWISHADQVKQFSLCVKEKLEEIGFSNISLYIDAWRSLNKRLQQRIYNPYVDIITAPWSPWKKVSNIIN